MLVDEGYQHLMLLLTARFALLGSQSPPGGRRGDFKHRNPSSRRQQHGEAQLLGFLGDVWS